ncbi:hypothetical protein SAMN02745166_01515 [Prosthecobacter debontii]|uniref:Uncharacterized protein n=2 Tax=Prosthecobacter debontii TaxID=48467 RepID=A0A1T4XIP1_9BACT|nr:hypothetical protein SAMN02745166_01515 [Prosthecobacter debontii]
MAIDPARLPVRCFNALALKHNPPRAALLETGTARNKSGGPSAGPFPYTTMSNNTTPPAKDIRKGHDKIRDHFLKTLDMLEGSSSDPYIVHAAKPWRQFIESFGKRPLFLNPFIEARALQLDTVLDLLPGHGLAEVAVEKIIEDFMSGDFGYLTEGWDLDDEEASVEALKQIVAEWKAEDEALNQTEEVAA